MMIQIRLFLCRYDWIKRKGDVGQTIKCTDNEGANMVIREECENRFTQSRIVLMIDHCIVSSSFDDVSETIE